MLQLDGVGFIMLKIPLDQAYLGQYLGNSVQVGVQVAELAQLLILEQIILEAHHMLKQEVLAVLNLIPRPQRPPVRLDRLEHRWLASQAVVAEPAAKAEEIPLMVTGLVVPAELEAQDPEAAEAAPPLRIQLVLLSLHSQASVVPAAMVSSS